jgi:hypothetical protein
MIPNNGADNILLGNNTNYTGKLLSRIVLEPLDSYKISSINFIDSGSNININITPE